MIDKHQHHQNKVRNSLYFDQDTKRLIEEKSAELRLSQKIQSGKASKDLSQKLDALLDAQGIIGSIGIMNIGMEDGGQSLMSRSIIIRGLINELHDEGIITQSEKELLND